jgi:hypothetical protein
MSNVTHFSEYLDAMEPKQRAELEAFKKECEQYQENLADVRQKYRLAKATIAEVLNVDCSSVAKIERNSDMLINTLRNFIAAEGGELELRVTFPNHEVQFLNFSGLENLNEPSGNIRSEN